MAAGVLPPESGSEFSPCAKCEHRDCSATRFIAGSLCRRCEKPLGWDVRYYVESTESGPVTWVHALCEELAIEAEMGS